MNSSMHDNITLCPGPFVRTRSIVFFGTLNPLLHNPFNPSFFTCFRKDFLAHVRNHQFSPNGEFPAGSTPFRLVSMMGKVHRSRLCGDKNRGVLTARVLVAQLVHSRKYIGKMMRNVDPNNYFR